MEKLEGLDNETDKLIMQNYESEFSKVESIAQVLTQMINEYKEKLQAKLSENMVKERN